MGKIFVSEDHQTFRKWYNSFDDIKKRMSITRKIIDASKMSYTDFHILANGQTYNLSKGIPRKLKLIINEAAGEKVFEV